MGGNETMTKEKYTWEVVEYDPMFYEEGAVIDYDDVVDLLNEQDQRIKELKRMLQLVSELESVRNENSVKEIVRNNLFGLDSVAGESANAFNDYLLLNKFFKEYYNEQWDNGKFD